MASTEMNRKGIGAVVSTVFFLLLLLFIYSIAEILLLLFIAVLFSLYLGAITDTLQRRFAIPRPLGLTLAILLTIAGVTGTTYLIVPPVAEQTAELITQLPDQLEAWEDQIIDLAEKNPIVANFFGNVQEGESYVGNIVAEIGSYFRGVVPYVFSGMTFLIHIISVLVMGIYMTLRPAMYREGLIALAPPVHRELVRDILTELAITLRAWIVGQLLAMFSLGVLTWIGLILLGVPFALAFGVFTGVVAIVPFFGTLVSTLLPALFVLGQGFLVKALLVALLGVVVHIVEANVIAPMIMERQVSLPPVLTLLSVLVMAHLMEIIGLLVAVPVLATALVIVRRIYVHRVLEGKGFRRAVRDQPVEVRLPGDVAVLVHPASQETSIPALLES
ncbi:MAG TPA: AI-2E family transporter [Longimicrobiales bacterium]|nr:AI-2E family transporter [Longimicrobiales bacterium]